LGVEIKTLNPEAEAFFKHAGMAGQRKTIGKQLPLANRHGVGREIHLHDLPPELLNTPLRTRGCRKQTGNLY